MIRQKLLTLQFSQKIHPGTRTRRQRFVTGPVRGVQVAPRANGGDTVKITLIDEDAIRLEPTDGPMTIEAPSLDRQYSPFHMLGGSLAYCTFSVVYSWAAHAKIPVEGMKIDVSWKFGGEPKRVSDMHMVLDWPALPAQRLNAAKRVAAMCTVHETLHHSTAITLDVRGAPAAASAQQSAAGASATVGAAR